MALVVLIAAIAFEFCTFEITNDDYLHLASAQQLLLGERPVRDFFEAGEFLFYAISAMAMAVAGPGLGTEAWLDLTLLGLGHALTYVVGRRLTGSHLLGLLAAAVSVLLAPRLYSYPKITLYALGLVLIYRYMDRRRRADLVWLGVFLAAAFLMRHDHGAVLGVTAAVAVALTHAPQGWRTSARTVGTLAAGSLLLVAPFALFVQAQPGGIPRYLRGVVETGQAEYRRTVAPTPTLTFDWLGPIPVPHAHPPRANVRWAPSADDTTRQQAEQALHLGAPAFREGRTWEYSLLDASRAGVRAIVQHPLVEDTSSINRGLFIATGPREDRDAYAWLYFLTVALPGLALLTLALDLRRQGLPGLRDPRVLEPLVLLVLTLLMQQFLLRAKSDTNIADVGVSTSLLAAWLLARAVRRGQAPAAWLAVRSVLALWLVIGTGLALAHTLGGMHLLAFALEPREQATKHAELLAGAVPPYGDDAARYVHACTRETDRLLVAAAYEPDLYIKAGRGFAAGRSYFLSFETSPENVAFSLKRMATHRVPVVLTRNDEFEWLSRVIPALHAWITTHYTPAGTAGNWRVLVDSSLPPTSTTAAGLPCFR